VGSKPPLNLSLATVMSPAPGSGEKRDSVSDLFLTVQKTVGMLGKRGRACPLFQGLAILIKGASTDQNEDSAWSNT
jgi:hypothetical protein